MCKNRKRIWRNSQVLTKTSTTNKKIKNRIFRFTKINQLINNWLKSSKLHFTIIPTSNRKPIVQYKTKLNVPFQGTLRKSRALR